ncbi:iron hydrogenase small subunit [Thermodesulfatator indicus DSM 15286]|uniref:Iron hydrogenase small subunit n=1 Tax=Thermodesulfatator indicus (strain DSM 15286 / JCM 11887 / CIR29812) TaxID=667014 RepID=F8AB13_THEID|nr:iron hydrogenase small subunit [Thermodesulfatator indicus]AEH44379.1 iron hydrogenase small subunit [Thermodesulfatator indicus DSM 15286]
MSKENLPYQYEEKPASILITRRTFFKVTGVITAYIAIGGFAITNLVKKRNKYITMRQKGLYFDDKRRQQHKLPASYMNPGVKKFYEEFAGHPLSETAHQLLHTHHYYVRWQLGAQEVRHG